MTYEEFEKYYDTLSQDCKKMLAYLGFGSFVKLFARILEKNRGVYND